MRGFAIAINLAVILSHVADESVTGLDALVCAVCGFAIGTMVMMALVDRELEELSQ